MSAVLTAWTNQQRNDCNLKSVFLLRGSHRIYDELRCGYLAIDSKGIDCRFFRSDAIDAATAIELQAVNVDTYEKCRCVATQDERPVRRPDGKVQIIVTSQIPDTKPLVVIRNWGEGIAGIREQYLEQNHLTGLLVSKTLVVCNGSAVTDWMPLYERKTSFLGDSVATADSASEPRDIIHLEVMTTKVYDELRTLPEKHGFNDYHGDVAGLRPMDTRIDYEMTEVIFRSLFRF